MKRHLSSSGNDSNGHMYYNLVQISFSRTIRKSKRSSCFYLHFFSHPPPPPPPAPLQLQRKKKRKLSLNTGSFIGERNSCVKVTYFPANKHLLFLHFLWISLVNLALSLYSLLERNSLPNSTAFHYFHSPLFLDINRIGKLLIKRGCI